MSRHGHQKGRQDEYGHQYHHHQIILSIIAATVHVFIGQPCHSCFMLFRSPKRANAESLGAATITQKPLCFDVRDKRWLRCFIIAAACLDGAGVLLRTDKTNGPVIEVAPGPVSLAFAAGFRDVVPSSSWSPQPSARLSHAP